MQNQLIAQLRKELYASIKRFKGNRKSSRYDTSDIVQESLIQVWKKMDAVGADVFHANKTFLKRVGQGQACNIQRHHVAQCRNAAVEENICFNVHANAEEPRHSAENEENTLRLLGAVAQLTAERQTVFCRRVMGRLSFTQIASETGESINIVRTHYKNAISDLRRILIEP